MMALIGGAADKLRGRSAAELRERLEQKMSALIERSPLRGIGREASDGRLLAPSLVAQIGDDNPPGEQLLRHFRTRQQSPMFAGLHSGAAAVALRTPRWAAERSALITAADRICAGSFDLLGYKGLSFGSPIDWHLDPTTGIRAPRRHWSRIRYLDLHEVGDHKVVWEINRHQHFVLLGRAYQATGDATYARCFAGQLTAWMDENPPKEGINWASSLEVAYRGISWLWALELFREAPELTPALLRRWLGVLHLHGRHLERYLSTYFSPNTHITGEALGLLYLGTCLPELRRSERWRSLGWSILARELPRQVHEDGVYFEQATYYHRYTVDIYLHAFLLVRSHGDDVPAPLVERLTLAAEHLADLTRPDGTIPVIGDDDGGRLLWLEERGLTDVRGTLGAAAVVLDRPDFAVVAGGATAEVLWLGGDDGARSVDDWSTGPRPTHDSRLYSVGGYVVMRDGWGDRASHAVVDCGPHGAMNCGHAHADALSIEITAQGCPLLVDPGAYTYTGSAADRDHFRSTGSHNTLTVDGRSSSISTGPFSWHSRSDARIEQWWAGEMVDNLVASHAGYTTPADDVLHRRQVVFIRSGYWVILDTVDGGSGHDAAVHFHLAVGATVTAVSSTLARIQACLGEQAVQALLLVGGDADGLRWGEDWVSRAYGARERAPAASAHSRHSRSQGQMEILSAIVPVTGPGKTTAEEIPLERGLGIRVIRGQISDILLFRRDSGARVGNIELDAGELAVVRRSGGTDEITEVALFGLNARLAVGKTHFHARGAAEFLRVGNAWTVRGDGRVEARDA
jgi:hypothetical protein